MCAVKFHAAVTKRYEVTLYVNGETQNTFSKRRYIMHSQQNVRRRNGFDVRTSSP